jgi:hypothetical protein
LLGDTSAEIVFKYLDHPEHAQHLFPRNLIEPIAITNNHFDQDGLIAVFALLHPQEALAHRAQLACAAHAGDFSVCRDKAAARISYALGALSSPQVCDQSSMFTFSLSLFCLV